MTTTRSMVIDTPRYVIQTNTLLSGWVAMWTEDDTPMTFASAEEAEAELKVFLDDIKEAVALGYMEEEYDPEDYRVVACPWGVR